MAERCWITVVVLESELLSLRLTNLIFTDWIEEFMVETIRKTGFADGYFDAYFSWGVFEHFENGLSH